MAGPVAEGLDFTDIFAALNAAKVQYLVVGGIAAIYHGVPRTTFDVDLSVHLETVNLERLDRALTDLGFAPRVPAQVTGLADPLTRRIWTRQKAMKVFSYIERTAPFRVVDIMVRPLHGFHRLYQRRRIATFGSVTVPIAPASTIIQLKTGTGRIEDERDIALLKRALQVLKRQGKR